MYDSEFLRRIGLVIPKDLSQEEVCEKYIEYLSKKTNLTEKEIWYSLLKDNPEYTNFIMKDGNIVSYGKVVSDWDEVKDGYRYYLEDGVFYRYDRSYKKEILTVDEINKTFGTEFIATTNNYNDKVVYTNCADVELLENSAFDAIYTSIINEKSVIGDETTYTRKLSQTDGVNLMINYLGGNNALARLELSRYTIPELQALWKRTYGDDIKITFKGGDCYFSTSSRLWLHDYEKLNFVPYDYHQDCDFVNKVLSDNYNNFLGVPVLSGNPEFVSSDNGVVLSFENYTEKLSDFMNQNFTLNYNGFEYSFNYSSVENPVETASAYLMSSEDLLYDDLGIAASLRMDTSIDNYKMLSSNCYSNIIMLENGSYRIYFQNGQFYDISKEDFESTTVFNHSLTAIDEKLYESNAYFSNVVARHFNSVMPNAVVDVRPIDDDNFIVIINGKEKRYSLNTLKYMIGDTNLSDIDINYYENVLLEKSRNDIEQYVMSKYRLSGYEQLEIVYNPITNKCQVVIDGENLTLTEEDDIAIAKFISDESKIDERTLDNVNNSTYINTGNQYIPKEFLNPCIYVHDIKVYRNFVTKLKDFEYDSLSASYGNLSRNFYFLNGQYGTSSTETLCSNNKYLKEFATNLAKQIENCLYQIENTDKAIKVKLDEWVDEFFEVSSLDYSGEKKIKLNDVDNQSSVVFWKKKSEEATFYAKELELIRKGYILITEDYKNDMIAAGFKNFEQLTLNDGVNFYVSGATLEKYLTKSTGSKFKFTEKYTIFDYAAEMLNNPEETANSLNNGTMSEAQKTCLSIFTTMGTILNVEENVKLENAFKAFGNMSGLYEYVLSDEYNEYYSKYEKMDKSIIDEYGNTYSYDDSLTYGMNVLRYMAYDKCGSTIENYDKKLNLYKEADSNRYIALKKEKDEYIENNKEFYNLYSGLKDNINNYVPYCYNQVKGYEYAIKFLEGKLNDLEISVGEIAEYTMQCFADGFVSPFSGICSILNPDLSANEYAKKYLGQMMISDNFDMNAVNNKYEKGLISSTERDLKEAVFKQLDSSHGLDKLKSYGDVSRVAGEAVMEILLEAGFIATGLGGTNCTKLAKLAKDFLVVSGKARSKYVDNIWNGYDESQARVMALAYFAGNFTFRAALDWGVGKLKFGKVEYDSRKGAFKIVDNGANTWKKYNDEVSDILSKLDKYVDLDEFPAEKLERLAVQLNNARLHQHISSIYSSSVPLANFGLELAAASTDINGGDWVDLAIANGIRKLYGEELTSADYTLDAYNGEFKDYVGTIIKAGNKNIIEEYGKIFKVIFGGK